MEVVADLEALGSGVAVVAEVLVEDSEVVVEAEGHLLVDLAAVDEAEAAVLEAEEGALEAEAGSKPLIPRLLRPNSVRLLLIR